MATPVGCGGYMYTLHFSCKATAAPVGHTGLHQYLQSNCRAMYGVHPGAPYIKKGPGKTGARGFEKHNLDKTSGKKGPLFSDPVQVIVTTKIN